MTRNTQRCLAVDDLALLLHGCDNSPKAFGKAFHQGTCVVCRREECTETFGKHAMVYIDANKLPDPKAFGGGNQSRPTQSLHGAPLSPK